MIVDLSGCIVLFKNSREILLDAIKSFLNTDLDVSLYLIDNSPTDELQNIISDDRVTYIHNPTNPGFGEAHNIALRLAIKNGSKYHLVLNPDVSFGPQCLKQILEFMESNPDVGNLMPKVTYPDGSLQYLCKLLPTPYDWIGRRFNPIKSMVEERNEIFELKFTHYNKIMEVPYLSGCFMFLRLSAMEETGLFDGGIFMYGEEADLCRRLISKGYKTVYFPNVSIIHHFEKGSHKSLRLTWIGIKSAIYYFNKWGWFFDTERNRINVSTIEKLTK